jgi:hypothetical protein
MNRVHRDLRSQLGSDADRAHYHDQLMKMVRTIGRSRRGGMAANFDQELRDIKKAIRNPNFYAAWAILPLLGRAAQGAQSGGACAECAQPVGGSATSPRRSQPLRSSFLSKELAEGFVVALDERPFAWAKSAGRRSSTEARSSTTTASP